MAIPERDDIVSLGRVSDEDKYALLEAADVLVLPSHLESLGIVLLEAWQVGTPCLVSAKNKVTTGQVARAGGGTYYRTRGLEEARPAGLGKRRHPGASGPARSRSRWTWAAVAARREPGRGLP